MKKKHYNLFFTRSKISKTKKNEDLFAGEWCLNKSYDTLDKNNSIKISNRETQRNIFKEAKICEKLYVRLLEDLILHLNKIHKLNWNKRSWEIFLGPWLNRYVTIIFDRYNCLDYIFKNYNIKKIQLVNDKKFNLVKQDLIDFRINSQKDDWNLKLFSKMYINYFDNKKIKKKIIEINSSKPKFLQNNLVKISNARLVLNKVVNFFIKKFYFFFNLVFYKTSINNSKIIFLLLLKNKKLYFPYNFRYQIPKINSLSLRRKEKIRSIFKLTKFEKILRELLFELLPFYYLESIKNLKYLNKNLILPPEKNTKVFSANALWLDGIFKFWLANAISHNSKLNYFQHGCNYGTTKYSYAENIEINVSDKFHTWGWSQKKNNINKFYSIKTLFLDQFQKTNTKKIMLVLGRPSNYTSHLSTGVITTKRTYIYFEMIIKICKKFLNRKDIFYRLAPNDEKYFNFKKKLSKIFENIRYEKSNKNLLNLSKRYGLIVHTCDGTSFLETISLNKPSILILSKELYKDHLRKSAIEYYKKLEKVKIIFTSVEKFIDFISKKDFSINEWWEDKNTQKARKEFCSQFCKKSKEPFQEIMKII